MSSKRSQRRKECGNKHRYKDQTAAWASAKNLQKKDLGKITAYPCRYCGNWHIGHVNTNVKRKPRHRRR